MDAYVKLAKEAIESYIKEGKIINIPFDLPEEMYSQKAGVFVSLHCMGMLRGCIGTISATTNSVAEEIRQNALSAATRDPRFMPVTEDELFSLDYSVDVLTDAEDIKSEDELDIKRYGVIVKKGLKKGLLLPDLEGINSVKEQIEIAKRKAGIKENESVKLQRFEVIRHH